LNNNFDVLTYHQHMWVNGSWRTYTIHSISSLKPGIYYPFGFILKTG